MNRDYGEKKRKSKRERKRERAREKERKIGLLTGSLYFIPFQLTDVCWTLLFCVYKIPFTEKKLGAFLAFFREDPYFWVPRGWGISGPLFYNSQITGKLPEIPITNMWNTRKFMLKNSVAFI